MAVRGRRASHHRVTETQRESKQRINNCGFSLCFYASVVKSFLAD
jgi:hypothetical protein